MSNFGLLASMFLELADDPTFLEVVGQPAGTSFTREMKLREKLHQIAKAPGPIALWDALPALQKEVRDLIRIRNLKGKLPRGAANWEKKTKIPVAPDIFHALTLAVEAVLEVSRDEARRLLVGMYRQDLNPNLAPQGSLDSIRRQKARDDLADKMKNASERPAKAFLGAINRANELGGKVIAEWLSITKVVKTQAPVAELPKT